jgi:hypothetical protein
MSASLRALELKSTRKAFSPEAFKKAPVVDKLAMYLIAGELGPYKLSESQQEYLEILEEAYTLIKEYRSAALARKMLLSRIPKLTHRKISAIQVVHDAQGLFGRFEDVHRPVQRGIIRENLLARILSCEKQLNTAEDKEGPLWEKLIAGYWKQLAEIDQVSQQEHLTADTSLPDIEFTNDPAALLDAVDDIDHEEI